MIDLPAPLTKSEAVFRSLFEYLEDARPGREEFTFPIVLRTNEPHGLVIQQEAEDYYGQARQQGPRRESEVNRRTNFYTLT